MHINIPAHLARVTTTPEGPRGACSCGWIGDLVSDPTAHRSAAADDALAHVALMRGAA